MLYGSRRSKFHTKKSEESARISFEICGAEHEPNRVCILPAGHSPQEVLCHGNWADVHNWVHPRCSIVGIPHEPHIIVLEESND